MKTDDLITMLSTNVEPADHRQVVQTIRNALAIAGIAVAVAVVVALGIRDDALNVGALAALVAKLGVTLANLGRKPDACAIFARFAQDYPRATDLQKRRIAQERQKNGCG